MKLMIPTQVLSRAISNVHTGQGISLTASEETQVLALEAGTFEYQVRLSLPAQVERSGAISLPADDLLNLASALASAETLVSVSREEDERTSARAVFLLQRGRYALRGWDDRVANLPEVSAGSPFQFRAADLLAGLRRVLHACVRPGEAKYESLGGVRFIMEPNRCMLVATDTHRLVQLSIPAPEGGGACEFTVPERVLSHLLRLKTADSVTVEMCLNEPKTHLSIRRGDALITTALLQGAFPPIQTILKLRDEAHTRWTLPTSALKICLKRLLLLARSDNKRVAFRRDGERLILTADAPEGRGSESVPLIEETRTFTRPIFFNARYLLDMLDAVASEQVVMEIIGDMRPVFFSTPTDDAFLEVIMPMSSTARE